MSAAGVPVTVTVAVQWPSDEPEPQAAASEAPALPVTRRHWHHHDSNDRLEVGERTSSEPRAHTHPLIIHHSILRLVAA
jgi:hypothetical protein